MTETRHTHSQDPRLPLQESAGGELVEGIEVIPEVVLKNAVHKGLMHSVENGGLPHKGAALEMHRSWFPDERGGSK